MTREFVTYEQALVLKELGFDEPCFGVYANGEFNELFVCGEQYYPKDPQETTNSYIIKTMADSDLHFFSKTSCTAPLYQQAFRWFREKHGLNSYIYQRSNITYRGVIHKNMKIAVNYTSDSSNYEEAEQACLDKLIEIVKNERQV